jgi:hypothetical protein
MMPNPFLSEQMAQAHRQKLLREAEQQRRLAHLARPAGSRSRRVAGQLGTLLLKLGAWLKQFEQPPPVLE